MKSQNKISIYATPDSLHYIDYKSDIRTLISIKSINELPSDIEDVNVIVTNNLFTIIPEELFDKAHSNEFLNFSCSEDLTDKDIRHSNLLPFNCFSIWAIDQKVKNKIIDKYPQAYFKHLSEQTLQLLFDQQSNALLLEIGDCILFASKNGNKLTSLTINSGKTLNDKIYFSLLPFQQLPKEKHETHFIGSKELKNKLLNFLNILPHSNEYKTKDNYHLLS